MERNGAIAKIRAALKRRSGKAWSVRGGTGTSWRWITIDTTPSRATWSHRLKAGAADSPENYEPFDTGQPGRNMSPAERAELGELLGLDRPAHHQGESVAASYDYRREYVERAEGRKPTKIAQPYWD